MDEENFIEDQILKHLGEPIVEVIIRTHHHKVMVMLGSEYIISCHEPNEFFEEDSFSEYSRSSSGMYDFDKVHSLPMIFL